jgi:hypothetical protein
MKRAYHNFYGCLFKQPLSFLSSPSSDILDVMIPVLFSLYKEEKLLLITTLNESSFKALLKRYGLLLSPPTSRVLCLRDDFKDFKDKYGIETVLEEISEIVSSEMLEHIVIHNFNAWFSDKDIPFIDKYVKLFTEFADRLNVNFSFWFVENSILGERIRSSLELFSLFGIEAVRQERIFNSFFLRPVKSVYPECTLTYRVSVEDKIVIEPLESLVSKPRIFLSSTNEAKRIADMLEFVLSEKSEVSQLESPVDAINCTLEMPDCFIIVSNKEYFLRIKNSLKSVTKNKEGIETVYVFISLSPLRSIDRVEFLKSGVTLLFSFPFSMEEFLTVMGKALKVNLSTDLPPYPPPGNIFVSSKEEIEKEALELCKRRKLFSIIGGVSTTPLSQLKVSFREYDRIYYDERTGETILFLYDVWKELAPKVVESRGIKIDVDTLLDTLDVKELLGIE